ncbi:MAG: GNAT family N-acetyltransferase [Candidatus Altiarchaeota archaeon]
MGEDIILRFYREGDETQILDLFRLVFNKSKTIQEWRWEFLDGPYGPAYILIAEDNGRIVGVNIGILNYFKIFEKESIAFLTVDVMVHPEYRSRRIYSRLYDWGEELARKRSENGQLIFTYGFIEETERYWHKKLSKNFLFPLQKYVKPLDNESLLDEVTGRKIIRTLLHPLSSMILRLVSNKERVRTESSSEFVEIREVTDDFSELFDEVSKDYNILLIRKKEYLNWRYLRKPGKDYGVFSLKKDGCLEGYIVLKTQGRTGFIVDILVGKEGDNMMLLLLEAEEYFRKNNVGRMVCYSSDKQIQRILKRNKFLRRSNLIVSINPIGGFPVERIREPDRWHLTLGDTDII